MLDTFSFFAQEHEKENEVLLVTENEGVLPTAAIRLPLTVMSALEGAPVASMTVMCMRTSGRSGGVIVVCADSDPDKKTIPNKASIFLIGFQPLLTRRSLTSELTRRGSTGITA